MNDVFFHEGERVLIFGTGKICQKCLSYFNRDKVLCFLDNDISKQGSYYEGKLVYNPQEAIKSLDFDVIYILNSYVSEIREQLTALGVNEKSILTYRQLIDDFDNHMAPPAFRDKVQKIALDRVNQLLKGKVAVFQDYNSVLEIFRYICNEYIVLEGEDIPQDIDMIACHGLEMTPYKLCIYNQALERNIPVVMFEDGFMRSLFPAGSSVCVDRVIGRSIILDGRGLYINAYSESEMERILSSDFVLTNLEVQRARELINRIVSNKLSKYNHQALDGFVPGRKDAEKVLVIDQVPDDRSISFGMASEETFSDMLESAIKENPKADILVKKHPATEKTHYANVDGEHVYLMEDPINPITLLEQVDKVYVCSSQMGFEALLCNKEVHVFGMPFYAGWGVTIDKIHCSRRKKKRTVEEIFYVAYIILTKYISTKKERECGIEEVIEELIDLRSQYFKLTT